MANDGIIKKKPRRRTERVTKMIQDFHMLFMQGKTPDEITEMYGVSEGYWRKVIKEIAERNNVDPDFYFQRNHGMHVVTDSAGRISSKYANIEEIKAVCGETKKNLHKLQMAFREIMEKAEEELKNMDDAVKQ